jgi:hypothetical protein
MVVATIRLPCMANVLHFEEVLSDFKPLDALVNVSHLVRDEIFENSKQDVAGVMK